MLPCMDGGAGAGVIRVENSPLGVVKGISGHTGVPPRSSSGGWSSAGHCYRCLGNPCGVSHSSPSISPHSGKAPSIKSHPLCLCVGMQGTKWCEIIEHSMKAAVWHQSSSELKLLPGSNGSPPVFGSSFLGDIKRDFKHRRGQHILFPR